VLYSFCAQGGTACTDGQYPYAGLIGDTSGNLYSTTYAGGAYGGGTVFELTPPAKGKIAWTETVLYSFCAETNCTDGDTPLAGVIMDASGNLYSTTFLGGVHGGGTVFELTPPAKGETAWTETVLYSFCAQGAGYCTDGTELSAGLIMDRSGNLYGTTGGGGAYKYNGTVFELTPPAKGKIAWTETVLYSFCAQGGAACTDGAGPFAGLIMDWSGNLYGTTYEGGANCQPNYGCGTVFELKR
jgi:hypothetical protein